MNQRIRKLSCLLKAADMPLNRCYELNSLLTEMFVEDIPEVYQQDALDHVSRVLLYGSVLDDHRTGLEKIYEKLSAS